MVDSGDGARSRSSAARRTSPPARPSRSASPASVMPDGTRLKTAKLRGQPSNGMILAEDEVGIGDRPRRDHGPRRRAGGRHAAGRRAADRHRRPTSSRSRPNRPDCLCVYGVAREVHAATGAPLAPPPWTRRSRAPTATSPASRVDGRVPRPVPALHPARVRGRDDRPVAGVAEGAADGRRAAADQQRRRHHQLRDAADRPAAARVRRRPRRGRHARGAARPRRREGRHARRRRAHAGRRHARHRRRGRADVDRRRHGRQPLRGPRRHHARPDGGRDLGRPEHPAHVDAARRCAPRPAAASRRACRPGQTHGGPGRRHPADGRADRRDASCPARSTCAREDRPPGAAAPARGAGRAAARARRSPRAEQARILEALGFAVADADDGLDVTVPHFRAADVTREVDLVEEVAPHRRLREAARHAAVAAAAPSACSRPSSALRRRAEDALVGAGLYEVVGWSFTSTAAQARLGTRVEPVRLKNPMSEEQAVMRTLAARPRCSTPRRPTPAAARRTCGCSRSAPSTCRGTTAAAAAGPLGPAGGHARRRGVGRAARCPTSARTSPRCWPAPLRPPSWNDAEPPAADFFAAKGVLEALGARAAGRRWPSSPPPSRSCTPAAPRACSPAASPRRLGRRAAPVARRRRRRLRGRPRACSSPARRRRPGLPRPHVVPGRCCSDLALTLGEDVPAAAVLDVVARGRRQAARPAPRSSTSTAARRSARAKSLALRLASGRADRTLTDEDVAPARDEDRRGACGRSSGRAPWLTRRRHRSLRLRGRARGAAGRPPPALRAAPTSPRARRPGSGSATSTRARAWT